MQGSAFSLGYIELAVSVAIILLSVLYLVFLQRKELKIKKSELDATRASLAQANFETTFFNLLRLHHERIQALEIYQNVGPNIHGRSCFNYIYYKSFVILYGGSDEDDFYKHLAPMQRAQTYYNQLYSVFESDLSYYFHNLYHVLHFVDADAIEPKWPYIRLLRAQLSSPELLLLFYHGLTVHGEAIRPLIEKYALLNHIPTSSLLRAEHKELYPEEAYKDGGY